MKNMVNNSLCYSLYLHPDFDNWKRQVILHYSLHTLFTYNPEPSFDINVFIQGPDYVKEQLLKRFPKIKLQNLEYNFENNDESFTLSKWYSVAALNQYDKVMFLDCDTLHRRSCDYIFDKYTELDFYSIYDPFRDKDGVTLFKATDGPIKINGKVLDYNLDVLGFKGINSGQMLFNSKALNALNSDLKSLVPNLIHFQNKIQDLINQGIFADGALPFTRWINEQFAGQKILLDNNISIGEFDNTDVTMSVFKDEWNNSTITHYISFVNFDVVPNWFIKDAENHLHGTKL